MILQNVCTVHVNGQKVKIPFLLFTLYFDILIFSSQDTVISHYDFNNPVHYREYFKNHRLDFVMKLHTNVH